MKEWCDEIKEKKIWKEGQNKNEKDRERKAKERTKKEKKKEGVEERFIVTLSIKGGLVTLAFDLFGNTLHPTKWCRAWLEQLFYSNYKKIRKKLNDWKKEKIFWAERVINI